MAGAWGTDLVVNVSFMDTEHDELIGLLLTLEEAAATDQPRRTSRQLLNRFRAEVEAHFAHEEDLMSAEAYPMRKAHTAQHALFLQELATLYEDPALPETPRRLVEFFQTWFARHVQDSDGPLARWLLEKGLAARSSAAPPLPRPRPVLPTGSPSAPPRPE